MLDGADNLTITGLEPELPRVQDALLRVHASQQQVETLAAAVNAIAANRHVSIGNRPVHCFALTISDCVFQFTLSAQVTQPATSGPATFVEVSPQDAPSTSAEVTANQISSTGAAPAVALCGITGQAIIGNIVTAANTKATSLAVAASANAAITGHLITGPPVPPASRPLPVPLESWLRLNTVM